MNEYLIKHENMHVLSFELIENIGDPVIKITWITDNKTLLPFELVLNDDGVSQWLISRVIPRNRAYADSFLSKCGLSINRPMDIISVSKGLSLNDVY